MINIYLKDKLKKMTTIMVTQILTLEYYKLFFFHIKIILWIYKLYNYYINYKRIQKKYKKT